MSKAILVIDMPDSCSECVLSTNNNRPDCCKVLWKPINHIGRIEDCPLKPVPEKINVPDFYDSMVARNKNEYEIGTYMYDRGHYIGYNMCIDKILNK